MCLYKMRMRRIAILSGAGISVESGLSTFRGGGGLWDNYPVEQVATPEGFRANPALVLEFYNKRRRELSGIKPNRAFSSLSAAVRMTVTGSLLQP